MSQDVIVFNALKELPEGYAEVLYGGNTYGITKTLFNKGKSLKVYAKELGGRNFISLNYYMLSNKHVLKPCEMSEEKVIRFLQNMVL